MSTKRELAQKDQRIADLELELTQAQDLAESQGRNVTLLAGRVTAHRTVVIEHIRECQQFPDNEQMQRLIAVLITELDVADLNISGSVRVSPQRAER